jgi:hypothetical protein
MACLVRGLTRLVRRACPRVSLASTVVRRARPQRVRIGYPSPASTDLRRIGRFFGMLRCCGRQRQPATPGADAATDAASDAACVRGADGQIFSSHTDPLHALLEDCTKLKEESRKATSFREACRQLGAVGDEIKLAARNAAQKVTSEELSIFLSKIFASCHKEVFLAQTLIEVRTPPPAARPEGTGQQGCACWGTFRCARVGSVGGHVRSARGTLAAIGLGAAVGPQ